MVLADNVMENEVGKTKKQAAKNNNTITKKDKIMPNAVIPLHQQSSPKSKNNSKRIKLGK